MKDEVKDTEFRDKYYRADSYKNINDLSELIVLMKSKSPYNAARWQLTGMIGKLEQAQQQRTPLSTLDYRKLEFEIVETVIKAYNDQVVQNSKDMFR